MNSAPDRDLILRALGETLPCQPAESLAPLPSADVNSNDIVLQFIRAVQENAAGAQQVKSEDQIPNAAAEYMRKHNLSPETVCTPEWAHLPWQNAGITAHMRAPQESDSCGVTAVAFAAADCGAMLARNDNRHQLTASLLPPHHIAIVRKSQIAPSLSALPAPPRGVSALFCGPSRTGDIEQTLTLGAHGPVSVHVIVVNDNAE